MTFKRYQALKKAWKKSPPAHVCLAAICEYLGMKLAGEDDAAGAASSPNAECYYDESYYDVPEQPMAVMALGRDFDRAEPRR